MQDSGSGIEAVVCWAIQDQAAHRVARGVMAGIMPAGYRSAMTQVMQIGALGCRVDCMGSAAQAVGELDPLAEAVIDELGRMGFDYQQLVMAFAMTGVRPDWMQGAVPRYQPVRVGGRVRVDQWPDYGKPERCWSVVRIVPTIEQIDFSRDKFVVWYDAMNELAQRLVNVGFCVSKMACNQRPWLTD